MTDAELRAAGIHPADLGVVPEPGAWLLMMAGFGFAGAALRRRSLGWAA